MNTVWENELLGELQGIFSDAGMNTSVQDIEERKVLVAEYEGEDLPEDCNISVEHLSEDSTELFILFTVRSGLDNKTSGDIISLLPYLNKFLTVGCFGLVESTGYFYFSCSFVIDERIKREKLIKIITAALGIADGTVIQALEILAPVLSGEGAVSGLMNDDTAIIQF